MSHEPVPVPSAAPQEFLPFQTYSAPAEAQPLLDALQTQGIRAVTTFDEGRLAFDPSFANNSFVASFIVKLQPADFERARQVQQQVSEQAIKEVDLTHYLFGFSDGELFDLLARPDEWSSFDVTLARHLLQQRGRDVSADTLELLRQRRLVELARPEESHTAWIVVGYVCALLGGAFGLAIGWHLRFHRKALPNGQRVLAFSAADRAHGLRILILGMVVLGAFIVVRLLD